MKTYQRVYLNKLRGHRNFLIQAIPKALDLAKRNKSNSKLRHMALKLYFSQVQRLRDIETEIQSYAS